MTKIVKKTKGGKIFAITIMLICFALCLTLADLFSTAITIGNFSGFVTDASKLTGYKIYAISTFQSSVKSVSEDAAKKYTSRNGAGYIWEKDSIYHVFLSAYENQNDAIKVKENLESSGETPNIIEVDIPEITIKSNLSSAEKGVLTSALNVFYSTYKSLYDISVSLDTSIKSETECKLLLSDVASEVGKIKTNFNNTFNPKLTNNLIEVKLKIDKAESLVKELIDFSSTTSVNFSSKIKYNYIELIKLNSSLAKDIKYSI